MHKLSNNQALTTPIACTLIDTQFQPESFSAFDFEK